MDRHDEPHRAAGGLRRRRAQDPRRPGRRRHLPIRGQKIFITFGEHDLADNIVHLVLARLPDAPQGTRGISLFLVPKILPDGRRNDLRCVSIEHKLGIHASPTCVMSYGDEGGATGWLIGEENKGMAAMFTMMNNARLNVGLQGVSIAERATQQAVAFARERVQGAREGRPARIIELPDVRRMLLRMKALTQAARALAYYTAGQTDRAGLGDEAARARADLLTPLLKAYGTDVGVEVTSLAVQVHGGMGYVEETGAAQHYRDARISPIYEGTNGIQAADLVGRKIGLEGGEVLRRLLAEIRAEAADEPALGRLVDACEAVAERLLRAEADDRLAASYPFLTMLATAVGGWLMARQEASLDGADVDPDFAAMKRAAARFYLDQIVPEALGLEGRGDGAGKRSLCGVGRGVRGLDALGELVGALADGPPDARALVDAERAHLLARLLQLAADHIGFGGLAGAALAPVVERVDRDDRDEQQPLVEAHRPHVLERQRHPAVDHAGDARLGDRQAELGRLAARGAGRRRRSPCPARRRR